LIFDDNSPPEYLRLQVTGNDKFQENPLHPTNTARVAVLFGLAAIVVSRNHGRGSGLFLCRQAATEKMRQIADSAALGRRGSSDGRQHRDAKAVTSPS